MSLSLFIHAANVGFMLMFAVVVAPAVFKVLSQKAAASYFARSISPFIYFWFCDIRHRHYFFDFNNELLITVVSTAIAFGFLFNAAILTPKINQFRDRANSGEIGAEKVFARLHLFSVRSAVNFLLVYTSLSQRHTS